MNLIVCVFGGCVPYLRHAANSGPVENEEFVMILGFLLNVFSIIVLGDYNPAMFPDGSLQEDSPAYDFAYHIAHAIGTIG